MQPGEVAGLTHVGMEPRFGSQLKDKDIEQRPESSENKGRCTKYVASEGGGGVTGRVERGEGAACDNKTASITNSTAFSSSDGILNMSHI